MLGVLHTLGVCTVINLEFTGVTVEIGCNFFFLLKKSNISMVSFCFKKRFQKYCGGEYEPLGK